MQGLHVVFAIASFCIAIAQVQDTLQPTPAATPFQLQHLSAHNGNDSLQVISLNNASTKEMVTITTALLHTLTCPYCSQKSIKGSEDRKSSSSLQLSRRSRRDKDENGLK